MTGLRMAVGLVITRIFGIMANMSKDPTCPFLFISSEVRKLRKLRAHLLVNGGDFKRNYRPKNFDLLLVLVSSNLGGRCYILMLSLFFQLLFVCLFVRE